MKFLRQYILHEDVLDDLDVKQSKRPADIIDDYRDDYDDASLFDHQFRIEWFVSYHPTTDDIDRQIEKINHILEASVGVTDYSNVVYFTLEDEYLNTRRPYILPAPSKHYQSFIAFSIKSDFKTVKQLFGFIAKLRLCLDREKSNGMGDEKNYSYIEIISSKNGKWGFPQDDYDTPDTYEAMNSTEIQRFVHVDKMLTAAENVKYLNEAYKVAGMFFDDTRKVINDFERYYPESLYFIIDQHVFRFIDWDNEFEVKMPEYNKVLDNATVDIKALAVYFEQRHVHPDSEEARFYSYSLPLTRNLSGFGFNLFNVEQFQTNYNFSGHTTYRFVYSKRSCTFSVVVGLGVIVPNKPTRPMILYLKLNCSMARNLSAERNETAARIFAKRLNILFGKCMSQEMLDNLARDVRKKSHEIDKSIS